MVPGNMGESRPSEEAVAAVSDEVRRFLRHYCSDPVLADDLTQDTLMRIAKSIHGFNGKSSIKTWALSIATRVATDHFRQTKRRIREVPMDVESEFVDHRMDVEHGLIVDEMSACVREVIDTLPEIYRMALILRDFEGMSIAEVAKIEGCSLSTAKVRHHRARKQLHGALGRACEFYSDSDEVLRCDRRS